MFAAELTFKRKPRGDTEQCFDALWALLPAWCRNGQILDEYFFAQSGRSFRAYVQLPETTSLAHRHDNKYVKRAYAKLAEVCLEKPILKLVGETDTGDTCDCKQPSHYILFTNFIQISPPMKCGDCFYSVPLYRLPKTYDESEYSDILGWEADYQRCDGLQMNCSTGERFGMREMSGLNSSLSKRGRELCQEIERLTGKPTYYYLDRSNAVRSHSAEQKRRCPSCNGAWQLEGPLHEIFDFCCEPCRLLSNISWEIRDSLR